LRSRSIEIGCGCACPLAYPKTILGRRERRTPAAVVAAYDDGNFRRRDVEQVRELEHEPRLQLETDGGRGRPERVPGRVRGGASRRGRRRDPEMQDIPRQLKMRVLETADADHFRKVGRSNPRVVRVRGARYRRR